MLNYNLFSQIFIFLFQSYISKLQAVAVVSMCHKSTDIKSYKKNPNFNSGDVKFRKNTQSD